MRVGTPAPDFAADTVNGGRFKLADYRSKIVLLDFWSTTCRPCINELPNIRRAYDQYAAGGEFTVIGILLDRDREKARTFVQQRKIAWPQIALGSAAENALARQYNVSGVPATFLIGRDGTIVAMDLRGNALDSALRGLMP